MPIGKKFGLSFVFIWFAFGGVAHFVITDLFVGIMPPYLPWHREAVYISGVFEILGALGLWLAPLRKWAGMGLFLLTLCVSPANIHMWLHPELFPDVPPVALTARLFVQVALLACIWWSTRESGTGQLKENLRLNRFAQQ